LGYFVYQVKSELLKICPADALNLTAVGYSIAMFTPLAKLYIKFKYHFLIFILHLKPARLLIPTPEQCGFLQKIPHDEVVTYMPTYYPYVTEMNAVAETLFFLK
jgi:hypothetical protein